MIDDKNIDSLVIQYLISKGYEKSAQQLENELQTISSSSSLAFSNNTTSTSNNSNNILLTNMISHVLKGVNYNIYDEEYGSFRSWSCSSLDITKNELTIISFPLFIYW